MNKRLNKFAEINEKRRTAEREAEIEYESALMDYNDNLRAAYNKYHDKLEAIMKDWQQDLQTIPE